MIQTPCDHELCFVFNPGKPLVLTLNPTRLIQTNVSAVRLTDIYLFLLQFFFLVVVYCVPYWEQRFVNCVPSKLYSQNVTVQLPCQIKTLKHFGKVHSPMFPPLFLLHCCCSQSHLNIAEKMEQKFCQRFKNYSC